MYAAWNGPLEGEQGVHRLVQHSENDPEGCRSSSSAVVRVDGDPTEDLVRTYVMSPYRLVHDIEEGDAKPLKRGLDQQVVVNGEDLERPAIVCASRPRGKPQNGSRLA